MPKFIEFDGQLINLNTINSIELTHYLNSTKHDSPS